MSHNGLKLLDNAQRIVQKILETPNQRFTREQHTAYNSIVEELSTCCSANFSFLMYASWDTIFESAKNFKNKWTVAECQNTIRAIKNIKGTYGGGASIYNDDDDDAITTATDVPGIEEVNMIKDDGTVIHFNNPKVQTSVPANTFSVTGSADNKQITEMLPGILNQLGPESLTDHKKLANNVNKLRPEGNGDKTAEKIKKLQAQQEHVRIGGKGTPRRKKKVIHKTAAADDKKLQSNLKKLSVTNIPGIEEVHMIKDDGTVIHFNNPKVQTSVPANTFSVTGSAHNKKITEMLPGILNQLGPESLTHLKKLTKNETKLGPDGKGDDEDVSELVGDFDAAIHKTAAADDKKLQSNLKKLSVTNIPGIEEVNMIKDDGTVIHFKNPKVQTSAAANTFTVTGSADNKKLEDLFPGILNQVSRESLAYLKKLANNVTKPGPDGKGDDEDVPELVGDFDAALNNETKADEQ